MSEPNLNELFEETRFPQKGWKIFTILLYFPIGVIIAILRVFIALHAFVAAMILPEMSLIKSIVLKVMFCVLGITVEEKNPSHRDKSAQVIVGNQITRLDFIAVHLATGSITWDLPAPLVWALGLKCLGNGKIPDINKIRAHLDKSNIPVFIQPEGSCTNNRVGLLKFSQWMAKVCNKIQPISIRAERPSFAYTSCDVLGSYFISELFWFIFSPSTHFSLSYLPVIQREVDECDEKFTERAEKAIAEDLGVSTTTYTASDKADYEKKYMIEYRRSVLVSSSDQSPLTSAELYHMASQVTEVLPDIPIDIILRDLNRTNNVDFTISNILEGNQYTQMHHQQQEYHPRLPSSSDISNSCANIVKSQPKLNSLSQGQSKMLSFMERKAKMIAEARRKYIEKHGLVDTWAE